MQDVNIDYIGVLDYLQNNYEIPYTRPEAPGLTQEEKNNFLDIKGKGQTAVAELGKIASRCNKLFGLDYCSTIKWLDGSNTKTRRYLWAEMKYKEYASNPISISLFVEKNDDVVKYRISLEIRNDNASKENMVAYHTHLDISKGTEMVYVSGSNKWGRPDIITDTADSLKAKINSGEIRKVQISVYVEPTEEKTNEQYDAEIMDAVKKIIPYYEHVIGKTTHKQAWLLTYNPERFDWKEYKEWCLDTKLGNKHTISWTCQSRKPVIGDEVFLVKTGAVPRGIIAHGYVIKGTYEADHYDPVKAAAGEKTSHIDVEYDWIQDYESEPILTLNQLEDLPNQHWTPQASGIIIKPEVVPGLKKLWYELINQEISPKESDNKMSNQFNKNMILYGPPGTGKTYSTAIYVVAICDGLDIKTVEKMNYDDVMIRYRELLSAGQVAFTTFHQSYGYEEFIEGIKPIIDREKKDVGYIVEPGIFKRFCSDARRKTMIAKDDTPDMSNARVWCILLDGTGVSELKIRCYKEGSIRIGWHESPEIINEETEGLNDKVRRILLNFQDKMEIGDIVVTERSNKSIDGIGVVTGDYEFAKDDDELWPRKRTVKWLMTNREIDLTELNSGKNLDRKTVYALDRIEADKILELVDNPSEVIIKDEVKPYVFVIDEINRGNISKIFGELITLIEDTKREGMDEQTYAILPYSGEVFSVPDNVYILGTMNTADRSIALMDTALRRRFQFIEMMPDVSVLKNIGADMVDDLDVAAMLEKINERIAFLYDREHTIGHAFFTKLAKSPTIETLSSIFKKSIIPLLQEYFYEDYQKIQLVLGDNGKTDPKLKFILDEEVKVKNIFKGNADDVVDLPEKKYIINNAAFNNLDSYKQII